MEQLLVRTVALVGLAKVRTGCVEISRFRVRCVRERTLRGLASHRFFLTLKRIDRSLGQPVVGARLSKSLGDTSHILS